MIKLSKYQPNKGIVWRLALIFFFCCATCLSAQEYLTKPNEAGIPEIRNYTPDEYGQYTSNWAIAQDNRGFIYFGNAYGVLEYDGSFWRLIKTTNETWIRSLIADDSGTIYVGAPGDFGYLAPDSKGQMRFISLLDKVAGQDRVFGEIYDMHCLGDRIYFRSNEKLYALIKHEIKVWSFEPPCFSSFTFRDTLYIEQEKTGVFKMVGDSLQLLPGSRRYGEMQCYAEIPYDKTHRLLATRTEGILKFDGQHFTRFPTEADEFLNENLVYTGTLLKDGSFALGTKRSGVVILDRQGRIRRLLNKTSGLLDQDVKALYCDDTGSLWLALNFGIAQVKIISPETYFGERQGVLGSVEAITRHNGGIYAATSQGVFYLQPGSGAIAPAFKRLNIGDNYFSLTTVGESLIAGRGGEVYVIDGENAYAIAADRLRVRGLLRQDTNSFFAACEEGLAVFEREKKRFVFRGMVPGISQALDHIVKDTDGSIWAATFFKGLIRLKASSNDWLNGEVQVEEFGKQHGLPAGSNHPASIKGQVKFSTKKGLRRFDEKTSRFIPDSSLGIALADTQRWISKEMLEDKAGQVVISSIANNNAEIWLAQPQADGSFRLDTVRFRRILNQGDFFCSFTDVDGVFWFGLNNGIARYEPGITSAPASKHAAFIRNVSAIRADSTIYGGGLLQGLSPPILPYRENAIRFEYSTPNFRDELNQHYQFRLDGFDETWSPWTPDTKKEYTNLHEGDYTFRVHSKDIYGRFSDEARFAFQILPPWYRTGWAFLGYATFAAFFLFGLVRLRTQQLQDRQKELEALVAERTAQVVAQTESLKKQSEELAKQSEQLKEMDKLKTRFFTNISHEFRTPLTIILGQLDKVKALATNNELLNSQSVMRRNARSLLRLINQLLDLSKLNVGQMQLRASYGDLGLFLRKLLMSFGSLADKKKIDFRFNNALLSNEMAHTPVYIYFDHEQIEKIIYNLLSNAFKFTPPDGKVAVTVSTGHEMKNGAGTGVSIQVANTGAGIPPKDIGRIFDHFYQVSGVRSAEGTGIGLALVKELVELHQGEIEVESIENRSTTFTVRLPLGRGHLSDEEIVETPPDEIAEFEPGSEPGHESLNSPEEIPMAEADGGENGHVVLVVEDHTDLRDLIRGHLEEKFQIVEAVNGAEGLAKANELVPDLVISDIMMPEKDGYELCKELKSNELTNHIPVILLTARAAAEDRLAGLGLGADDYLTKPFDHKELQIRVHNLIQSRAKMREKFSSEMLLKPTDVTVPSAQRNFLERVKEVIEKYLDDEEFSVEILSKEVGLSRAQLHRKLSAISNQSPSRLIRSFRMQRAAELIKQDAGDITEIAYQVGFSSQPYFSSCFHEEFGCTPTEFKKQMSSQTGA